MKLIHLSDLHIGKSVNGFSMANDQRYILRQILNIIADEQADGVMIAGDVYDKSIPSGEAVTVFDDFLTELCRMNIPVFIISGNHDSAERLSFGGDILAQSGVHISPVIHSDENGKMQALKKITMSDENGGLNIYLLPFIKPVYIRKYFEDVTINDTNDAVKAVIDALDVDENERNVLIAHQFVTGASTCESEEVSVGGSDNVDSSVFDKFDYVALGHIHTPQKIGRDAVRYCGSPLKYSFSECGRDKTVTVVELGAKNDVNIREIPLKPLHDMREIKGSYLEITDSSAYDEINRLDYLHITLTEDEMPGALAKLRVIYPNIMRFDYENASTLHYEQIESAEDVDKKSPLELLCELYLKQNGEDLNEGQIDIAKRIFEKDGER